MKKQLVTIPHRILSEVTSRVTSFDKKIKEQIALMRKFLKAHDGAGLAANQIGFENRIFIAEFDDESKKNTIPFQAFINPEIVECSKDLEISEEGCLSVPNIELPVERAKKIKVRFQNPEGKIQKITAKNIFARIIQHETDHLNGIIFTQRVKAKFFQDNPNLKKLKIAFFGSGSFAATILEGLILIGLKPLIFTEKGKPAGRGQEMKLTPVAEMAKRFNKNYTEIDKLTFCEEAVPEAPPESVGAEAGRRARLARAPESKKAICQFMNSKTDLLICADFGQIIPEHVLKQARIAINIHPSLLPKYRGPTPVQTAILEGENKTGVTIIKMSSKIDKGPILAQIETGILPDDNSLTLSQKLATLALQLLFQALPRICKNELQEIQQNENDANLTHKFQKTDGKINWQEQPEKIYARIRAFYPWPGSYTFLPNGKRLIIHRAHIESSKLLLDIVQIEGGKPVKWQEFLHGWRDQKPSWLDKVK